MTIIRKFLLRLRQIYSQKGNKALWLAIGIYTVLTIVGFVIDSFAPWNFILQLIRMVVAVVGGSCLFAFVYLYLISTESKRREDEEYMSMREKYSKNQRRNLAIISLIPLFLLVFIFGSGENILFTFISSFAIFALLGLISFMRSTRYEEVKSQAGIPDLRDIDFERKKKERIEEIMKERKEKEEAKKNKKTFLRKRKEKDTDEDELEDLENDEEDEENDEYTIMKT